MKNISQDPKKELYVENVLNHKSVCISASDGCGNAIHVDVDREALLDCLEVAPVPQPYDMPSPEADALDRIASAFDEPITNDELIASIYAVLRSVGWLF